MNFNLFIPTGNNGCHILLAPNEVQLGIGLYSLFQHPPRSFVVCVRWSMLYLLNWVTSWSRDLLQKFIVAQVLTKIHGAWRFITVFAWSRSWILSWARWIRSTSSHLFLRGPFQYFTPVPKSPNLYLPLKFSYNNFYPILAASVRATFPTGVTPWYCHSSDIC